MEETLKSKILIVDDEPQIIQYMKALLSDFGYETGALSRAEYLFQRLEVESFDLILMDLHMPGIDGLTLVKQLKGDQSSYREIPVIMLTGETQEQVLADCFESGVVDFINKPIHELTLRARIRSALDTQAHIQTVRKQNAKMKNDLRLAEIAQRSALPSLPDQSFLQITVSYLPFGNVSGDTYDIAKNQDGAINFFLGDATGHDIAAAFITMMVQMGLVSLPADASTNYIMSQLNLLLASRIPQDKFVTGVYLRITPQGTMSICNAGHPVSFMISANKEVGQLVKRGQPLGMLAEEKVPYVEKKFQLQPGNKILLYTDGILEWKNEAGEEFGEDRLCEFLEANRDLAIDQMTERLLDHVRQFAGEIPCRDDLTLLGIQYKE
ncbi:MAG: fused response regulator/phosphatase [SAR324 cluster bacterium]|nr:fused response regulator/phosphatase [SAR324 cluster bacterium]